MVEEMKMTKKANELKVGDRIKHTGWKGQTYELGITSAPFQSKQDPGAVCVFTDLVGVLSAVTFAKDADVEVVS